jgi:hypothetical protein
MYLVYPQDRRPTAKLRSVVDFLMARFGAENSFDSTALSADGGQ